MKKPRTEEQAICDILEPFGFIDGKYGELPFKLRHSGFTHRLSPTGGGHYHVEVDGRTIAEVIPQRDGTYHVEMKVAEWLRPENKPMDLNTFAKALLTPLKSKLDYDSISRSLTIVDKALGD